MVANCNHVSQTSSAATTADDVRNTEAICVFTSALRK